MRPGSSRDVVSLNIQELQTQGVPHKQAVAMALTLARETGAIWGTRSRATRLPPQPKFHSPGGV